MTESVAADQKQLDQISQTQLKQQPEEHDWEDNVRGHLEEVERCAGALVKGPLTTAAAKPHIAQIRLSRELSGPRGAAIGTGHPFDSPYRAGESVLTDPVQLGCV